MGFILQRPWPLIRFQSSSFVTWRGLKYCSLSHPPEQRLLIHWPDMYLVPALGRRSFYQFLPTVCWQNSGHLRNYWRCRHLSSWVGLLCGNEIRTMLKHFQCFRNEGMFQSSQFPFITLFKFSTRSISLVCFVPKIQCPGTTSQPLCFLPTSTSNPSLSPLFLWKVCRYILLVENVCT